MGPYYTERYTGGIPFMGAKFGDYLWGPGLEITLFISKKSPFYADQDWRHCCSKLNEGIELSSYVEPIYKLKLNWRLVLGSIYVAGAWRWTAWPP